MVTSISHFIFSIILAIVLSSFVEDTIPPHFKVRKKKERLEFTESNFYHPSQGNLYLGVLEGERIIDIRYYLEFSKSDVK